MARKQRVRLASDVLAPPPGMSAFADLLDQPEKPSPVSTWERHSDLSRRYCDLFPYTCRSLGDHAAHPTALDLALSSEDLSLLRRLSESTTPSVLKALLLRADLPSALVCSALHSVGSSVPVADRDLLVLTLLERPSLSRQVLEATAQLPLSGEVLLALCEHVSADDRVRAYVGAYAAAPHLLRAPDRPGRQYAVRAASGLWGRAAWSLVVASPALPPDSAVRRARPLARSASAESVVETLEALAPEWHGSLDELCRTATLLV